MFYDLIYIFGAVLTLPYFLIRAAFAAKYRTGLKEKLGFIPVSHMPSKETVWFHCVSVGETLASVNLIQEFRKAHPELAVAVSTTTYTGRQVAEKHDIGDVYFYYPFDFSWTVSRVVSIVKPNMLVLTELEVWPNMVRTLSRKGIPVGVVNGRLSARSFRHFSMFRRITGTVFSKLTFCSVQDETYGARFAAAGVPEQRITVTGNMKYDSLNEHVDEEKCGEIRKLLNIDEQDMILMGGSTHDGEERNLLDAYTSLLPEFPGLRLVLVPRHPERLQAVCTEIKKQGRDFYLKTKLTGEEQDIRERIIIVDTMGELSMLYSMCTIAFVGGSFSGTGGHNMLEPAVFRKPVIVGPDTFNFEEDMKRLKDHNGICEVSAEDECAETVRSLLADQEKRLQLGKNAYNVIQQYRGAVRKNAELLEEYF